MPRESAGIVFPTNKDLIKNQSHELLLCFFIRFSPLEETFHTGAERVENSCYCPSPPCPPSGIFDVGAGCKVLVCSRHLGGLQGRFDLDIGAGCKVGLL